MKYCKGLLLLCLLLSSMIFGSKEFSGKVPDCVGNKNITLKLYISKTSELPIWTETHNNVVVSDGNYNLSLGEITPLIEIDDATTYYVETYIDGELVGSRSLIDFSETSASIHGEETPADGGGILEEMTPSLEIGNGTDDVIVVDGSDFGIGLAAGADATGRLEVRGDEVRVWDGSASVAYANGEGDVFIEDQLEVDNTIYASHYRDNAGGLLVNAASGDPISVSEDSDGSFTIGLDVGGVPTNVLVLDEPCGGSPWTSPYADALDVLGWSYTEATDVTNFYTYLTNGTDWDLVIFNIYSDTPIVATYQALADELTSGDAVIYNEWTGSRTGTGIEALRTAMGIATAPMTTYSTPAPLFAWDTSHELYTTPNSIASSFSTSGDYCGSERHVMTVTTGTAVTGFTVSPTVGQAAVVASPSGKGIIMSEVTFVFTSATLLDFLVNQISYVCNLSGTSFNDDDWSGAGSGTMYPVNSSDNIGLGTTSATGKLDVRGNEVRVWDGSASVGFANGSGDLFVEDALEVDNIIYASHYRDNTGGSLINVASGSPLSITEDADGSYTIGIGSGDQVWNFNAGLEGWSVSNPCAYAATWALVSDGGRNVVKANYNYANTSSMLLSPVVSISGGTVNLEYIHRWSTESCCDEAFVKYRLDGGAWQHFTPTTGAYTGSHLCDYDPTNSCTSRTQTSYYGSGGYATHSGDISAGTASTIQFAMAITSDGSVTSTGWYIDEVTLSSGGSGSLDDNDWTGAGTGTMTASNTTDNVGIGTSTATGKLDVRGDEVRIWDGSATVNYASAAGDLYVEDVLEVDNSVYVPRVYDANSTGYYIDPASTSVMNVADHRNYIYNTGSSYGGAVGIADYLVPTSSNTYDLGTTSYYWRNVYATRYYDANNAGYYCDPAGANVFAVTNQRQYIYNTGGSYGGYVAFNDHIVPTSSSFSLGYSTSYDWDDLWLSGMIYLDGSSGSSGQVLTTNGSGDVYWSTAGGASEWYDYGSYLRTREGESVYPYSSNSYDLGSTSYYWRYVYATRYYDANSTSYYLDPNGSSYLNYVYGYYDYMYRYYDRNNAAYYLDPASTSILSVTDQRAYIYNGSSAYGGGVAINDNLVPTGTAFDLGNGTSYDWDDLWISGMIYIDGSAGSNGQVLTTNGSGDVSWQTPSGSGTVEGCTSPSCGTTDRGVLTPTTSYQYASYSSGELNYYHFAATAGRYYNFSLCSNFYDSYIRIYNSSCTQVAYNDDYGPYCSGTPASIHWFCTTTGNYTIAPTRYSCSTWSNSGSMQYWWSSSFAREVEGGEEGLSEADFIEPEVIREYGTEALIEGYCHIDLPRKFATLVDENMPFVTLTPMGNVSLYIENVTSSGFDVRSEDASDEVLFNWMALGEIFIPEPELPDPRLLSLKDELYSAPESHSYEEWRNLFEENGTELYLTEDEYQLLIE